MKNKAPGADLRGLLVKHPLTGDRIRESRCLHGVCVSCGFIPLAWYQSPHERALLCNLFDDFMPGISPIYDARIEHHDIAVAELFQ